MRMGIGDWGLGIWDWGLGPIPNPQSPIPNPQSPIPNSHLKFINYKIKNNESPILFKLKYLIMGNLFLNSNN